MTSILPKLKVDDVPENRAERLRSFGVVGKVDQREIANGFIQVTVPIYYLSKEAIPADSHQIVPTLEGLALDVAAALEQGTIEKTAEAFGLRCFTARWNVRAEWFSPTYGAQVTQTRENKQRGMSGPISDNELVQYDINMSNLTRGLFSAAGLEDTDFALLTGKVTGFSTRNRKDDVSRLDIQSFYSPHKKEKKQKAA